MSNTDAVVLEMDSILGADMLSASSEGKSTENARDSPTASLRRADRSEFKLKEMSTESEDQTQTAALGAHRVVRRHIKEEPEPRLSAVSVLVGEFVVMFGGFGGFTRSALGDTWVS